MLYAFGSNGSSQLGLGHNQDLLSPHLVPTEGDWKVKQFAAGGNHTVLLCDDGRVRVTGNNEDGRCGIPGVDKITRFQGLSLPESQTPNERTVAHIAASWSSTTLAFTDGSVYTCGTGNNGELGLGTNIPISSLLQRIPSFPPPGLRVVSLASGMGHTVAVLSNGEVYGWGKGRKGQIGEPAENVWEPRRISNVDTGVVKAVCGEGFTVLAGDATAGVVNVLGSGRNDRFRIKANAPATLEGWKNIAASWCSILVLKDTGRIIAWGRNDHGQLPPPRLPDIRAIAAGSEHCLAVTVTGQVFAWGWGEHGNCGVPFNERGDVNGRWNEIEAPGIVARVYAGCATSFIEVEERGVVDEG